MNPFATVVAIKGNGSIFAVDASGNTRQLKVGDALREGERIRTSGDAAVQLLMGDGSLLSVAAGQTVQLDASVLDKDMQPVPAPAAATTPGAIQAVIQALQSGGDLSEVLDAAAAGVGGGGGNDGGHSFVRLARIAEGVDPEGER